MKLLTAAAGDRDDDFCWTVPGELVIVLDGCDASVLGGLGADCNCGCTVSWLGLASSRATTAAVVGEMDITREQVAEAVSDALELADDPEAAAAVADEMLEVAGRFPAGTMLRRLEDHTEAR